MKAQWELKKISVALFYFTYNEKINPLIKLT